MPTSYKDLLAQAEAAVPKLSPAQAETSYAMAERS